jgi:hypothetical protein
MIIRFLKNKLATLSIFIVLVIVIFVHFNLSFWKHPGRIISNDIIIYYAYLPATFIYHDISLRFRDTDPAKFYNKIWANKTESGKYVLKMSMGMSMMYAPFFLMAHTWCYLTGRDTGGYSPVYEFFLIVAAVFYLALGLFTLKKILLRYFNPNVSSLTILGIGLGTNLFYYSALEAPMSHVFNFCLFTLFINFTIQWFEKPSFKYALTLGLITGLITLIRPTNIIILLVFLFWDVVSFHSLKYRIRLIMRHYRMLFLFVFCSILVWIPQFIYWRYVSGSWIYYSYGNEHFYFGKPEIINTLFSYRKGWLLYTPIMALALAGIPVMFRVMKEKYLAVMIYTAFCIYVVSSWWCWWYGGSFGLRAFIESYAILAIPLAVMIKWLSKGLLKRIILGIFLVFVISFNLFQTAQYYYSAIHWDSMTKAAYWDSFGRLRPSAVHDKLLKVPDYENAIKGQNEK